MLGSRDARGSRGSDRTEVRCRVASSIESIGSRVFACESDWVLHDDVAPYGRGSTGGLEDERGGDGLSRERGWMDRVPGLACWGRLLLNTADSRTDFAGGVDGVWFERICRRAPFMGGFIVLYWPMVMAFIASVALLAGMFPSRLGRGVAACCVAGVVVGRRPVASPRAGGYRLFIVSVLIFCRGLDCGPLSVGSVESPEESSCSVSIRLASSRA